MGELLCNFTLLKTNRIKLKIINLHKNQANIQQYLRFNTTFCKNLINSQKHISEIVFYVLSESNFLNLHP